MSNLIKHAKREFEILEEFEEGFEKDEYSEMIKNDVLKLIKVFSRQGHSGGSAYQTISLFSKLARYETLSPITDDEKDWVNVDTGYYQNRRCSALFKDTANTKEAYYLDAIVWVEPNGYSYTGGAYDENNSLILSRNYVKCFPFVPKTFYVKVSEPDALGERKILDKEELLKALDYYTVYLA